MSKAEDLSRQYKDFREQCGIKDPVMLNEIEEAYFEGYHQAEKDLGLTIDDIEKIHTFLYAVKNSKQGVFTFTRLSDEKYQEVLKRFNGQRNNTTSK